MAQAIQQVMASKQDVTSEESRKKLTILVMRLFALWGISSQDQLNLLGLSTKSRAMLSKFRKGTPISNSRDALDRVGWLLAIHKALRLLYPRNEAIRYSWVRRPNRAFENFTPLSVMLEEGIIGIAKVSRYLDLQRGH